MSKRSKVLWLLALCLGWGFDFLFWKKSPGISIPIFTLLSLAVGLFLAWREGLRPARASLVPLFLVIFFSLLSILRQEPLTLFATSLLSLACLALLAHTFLGGRWLAYSLVDYAWGLLQLGFSALTGGLDQMIADRKSSPPQLPAGPSALRQQALPVARGILLASPVLVVFALLLASADPVFSRRLNDIFAIFQIQNLPEYLFRLGYILLLAYLLAGIFLHALTRSQDEHMIGIENTRFSAFLGLTEAAVILGSVDLLFTSFVGIQFRYFFGGNRNISLEGYTYAEYARRGFGELAAVAFFSLLLFWVLSSVTCKGSTGQRRIFSGLGIALVILVAIILVSALQRLLLYEQAYGFTRLRTYTHVFMIWLGLLLAAVALLELTGRMRFFAAASLFAVMGFVVSLSLMNVDGFIARQNVARAQAGAELDIQYLGSLSVDAVPALVEMGISPGLPASIQTQVRASLACQAAQVEAQASPAWQSFRLPVYQARRLLEGSRQAWQAYPTARDEYGRWMVKVEGKEQFCSGMAEEP